MTKPNAKQTTNKLTMCGYSYRSEPYGGGVRYHCPSCDVRKNAYGITLVSWTNSHTNRRFCNNTVKASH